jgi:uncharacterized protein YkwD
MRPAAVAAGLALMLGLPAAAAGRDCPDADLAADDANAAVVADAVVCLIDAWRSDAEALPLVRSSELDLSSRRHSRDMVARRYLAHRRRNGPTVLDRIRASGYFDGALDGVYSENIGVVPRETATARTLVDAWLASPGHRENIAHPAFREIGVGFAFAPADATFYPDYPSVVVTTDFGQRTLRPRPRRHALRCTHPRGKRRARPYCGRRG